jgi:solute:Na+ symporter, SSS family
MHWIDWMVMLAVLAGIIAYGIWKTRSVRTAESYLRGDRELNWWTIGLSVMATQASAITFLSTPGQGYDDGMRFVQFYYGMPLAMILICIFILPIYYRLNVYTAYEYLENRFDQKTRTLAAVLFLFSRGMAAGFTISAPSIILNNIMGWNLHTTIVLIGLAVTLYTVMGGTKAVSFTQKQQMTVMLGGLILAAILIVFNLPKDISLGEAVGVAREMGKMEALDVEFDLSNRYNIWSGMIAALFLFLSYFGTDQSQVQRYLTGRSLRQSRVGLLMNGFIKIPMQYLVLFTGVMVFIFFQFVKPPIHFNKANLTKLEAATAYQPQFDSLKQQYDAVFDQKQAAVFDLVGALRKDDPAAIEQATANVKAMEQQDRRVRANVDNLLTDIAKEKGTTIETNDRDYVFITYVINYLPRGVVGLLFAVIFCAAMSSTASELTALSTTTVVDIYRRSMRTDESDEHYLKASKILTFGWGVVAVLFAAIASLFENLIQAVNIVGSLLYGTILGIFLVAFFFKRITATPVFIAGIVAEAVVVTVYFWDQADKVEDIGFLWLNPIGCAVVIGVSFILQLFTGKKTADGRV